MSLSLSVGLSGGLDSTVLMHLLMRMHQRLPQLFSLRAIHVHHGLQPAADDFVAQCEKLCRTFSVPLDVLKVTVDPKAIADLGLEAAARNARYQAIARELPERAVLVLGHHRDDLLETALLQWIRGAGLEGLSAMKRLSSVVIEGRSLLRWRPLLDQSRQALMAYAKAEGLQWIEDPTNSSQDFARNRIRQEVMPVLKSLREGADLAMARSISHLQTARELLELVTDQAMHDCLGNAEAGQPALLRVGPLMALDEALAARVFRAWLRLAGAPVPPARRLFEFMRQLREAREPFAQMELGGPGPAAAWRVIRDRAVLQIAR